MSYNDDSNVRIPSTSLELYLHLFSKAATATAVATPEVVRAREEMAATAVEVSKAWARVVMTATE
jgi:hypothetical protein